MRLLKFASEVRAADDGVITAILSTESVDRDGDVVRLDGWDLTNFTKAPRLMSCHNYGALTAQIGEWKNVHVDPVRRALVGEAHYYTGQGNPEADWGYFLATQGQATYSVGFAPIESTPRKGGGRVYTGQELLEVSHVPVPAQPDALQLMAKAAQWTAAARRKWDSSYMPNPTDDGFGPMLECRCIVAGCDDASQTTIPICSEHLKYLMNADPEPPGSPPDGDDLLRLGVLRSLRRVAKAGRVISSANMGKLHSAMQALSDVHNAACDGGDDCPLDNDEGDGPSADKGVKAAGEGSGSSGGVTVAADGSHAAFTGTHTHPHSAAGDQGGDDTHSHSHAHDGDSSHTGSDHVAAHKGLSAADVRALIKAELAAAQAQADAPTETRGEFADGDKSAPPAELAASLADALTKALEGVAW